MYCSGPLETFSSLEDSILPRLRERKCAFKKVVIFFNLKQLTLDFKTIFWNFMFFYLYGNFKP